MRLSSSFLAVLLVASTSAQTVDQTGRLKNCSSQVPKQVPTVSFCELVRNPAHYDGKIVRLRVKYLGGGETRVIFDKKCERKAWVEFDHVFDGCTAESVRKRFQHRDFPATEGLFNGLWESEVITIGMFVHDKQGLGHLNAYKYGFTMKWLEKVKRVPKKVA
jgi:hypothetical protein